MREYQLINRFSRVLKPHAMDIEILAELSCMYYVQQDCFFHSGSTYRHCCHFPRCYRCLIRGNGRYANLRPAFPIEKRTVRHRNNARVRIDSEMTTLVADQRVNDLPKEFGVLVVRFEPPDNRATRSILEHSKLIGGRIEMRPIVVQIDHLDGQLSGCAELRYAGITNGCCQRNVFDVLVIDASGTANETGDVVDLEIWIGGEFEGFDIGVGIVCGEGGESSSDRLLFDDVEVETWIER